MRPLCNTFSVYPGSAHRGWIPLLPFRLTLPLNFRNSKLMMTLTAQITAINGRNFFSFVREKDKTRVEDSSFIFGLTFDYFDYKGWYIQGGATNRWTTRTIVSCKRTVPLKFEEGNEALSRMGYRLTLMQASSNNNWRESGNEKRKLVIDRRSCYLKNQLDESINFSTKL